ncbi:MAG TPA: histidine kinase dimerization/phospho-acceptor domain-containing protein [Streptosporangiaceae bacterium]|nr:histidine kinase dimerization/phospho-acceptor domain-containing protein [Streptosporangiaceae bacterium]
MDEALLARIGTLTASSPGVLLARSVPVGGQCLCALALIGDVTGWDDEVRATAHAVAAIVATQIRHANNIARLERSHAALADQTERLNHLITAAIPGVLITDEQGIVTNASESFGEMFGLTEPSQLAGTPAVAVMHHIRREFADPARFTRRIAAVVRARQPLTGEQIQAADGRTIEGDYWPVLVDGPHRGDIWLTWDMSDRRALEQQRLDAQRQLTEQNEQLRKLDAARNQFLAIVSHELRTPLTSIVSFTELIRGEADGLTPDGIRFPRHHRAQRRPAAPARRRPAHAGPARGRRAAAGPGPGLGTRPGPRGGQVGVGRRGQAGHRHRAAGRHRA